MSLLGEINAYCGRQADAITYFEKSLLTSAEHEHPGKDLLTLSAFARILAESGDIERARDHVRKADELSLGDPIEHFAQIAWNIAAAYLLVGTSDLAQQFAQRSVAAFVDEALRMDADLAQAYASLPWHQHATAFLQGRSVPLGFAGSI
ncbi:MAG: hypothetical protein ACYDA1_03175 [Vulcanimicrobiaceae bacterium]